jgi:hypothetical protein
MEYFSGRENFFRKKILPVQNNPDTCRFFPIPSLHHSAAPLPCLSQNVPGLSAFFPE